MKSTPPPGKKGPEPWTTEWMNQGLQDKRVLAAVCALIAVPTLVFLFWQPEPAKARVSVSSKPEGAKIAIDGKSQAKASNAEFLLPPGKHKIKLSLPGYRDKEAVFDAKSDAENPLAYELDREDRKVLIASTPPGAALKVNDRDTGKVTDAELSLAPGKHTVRLTLSGYRPAMKEIDVPDKDGFEVEFALVPRAGGPTVKAATIGPDPTGRGGRYAAVLVATPDQGYPFAEADVDELAEVLARAGYAKPDVVVAKSPGASRALDMILEAGAKRGPTDTLLVVFAGREAAPVADALRVLASSRAGQKLLIADIPRGADPPPPGVATLFSRSGSERRYLHMNWQHGAFMYAVTLGVGGAADSDRNGEVTVDELGRFVADSVASYLRKEYPQQPGQTASRSGDASSGVVAVTPADGPARLWSRGLQSLDAGDAGPAVDDLTRAVARDRSFAPAIVGRARAILLRGALEGKKTDFPEAIGDCLAVTGLDPKNADAFATRGELLLESEKTSEALADLDLVINSLAPEWTSAYQTRARARREQRSFPAALADLDKAAGLAPFNYALLEERGAVRFEMGDYTSAERDLLAASALNPNWYLPYHDLAVLARRRNDPAAAQKWQGQSDRAKASR